MNEYVKLASELSNKFCDVTITLEFECGAPSSIIGEYRYNHGEQFLNFCEYIKSLASETRKYHYFTVYVINKISVYIYNKEIKKAEFNN